jgi:hypothetical protein
VLLGSPRVDTIGLSYYLQGASVFGLLNNPGVVVYSPFKDGGIHLQLLEGGAAEVRLKSRRIT